MLLRSISSTSAPLKGGMENNAYRKRHENVSLPIVLLYLFGLIYLCLSLSNYYMGYLVMFSKVVLASNTRGDLEKNKDTIRKADEVKESCTNSEEGSENSYNIELDIENYTPLGGGRYAEYKDGDYTPEEMTVSMKEKSDNLARSRRVHVRNAMRHAWKGYKKYAWGKDELLPISNKGRNNYGGIGCTLVDSLDTLWLMDLKDEFWEARDWVSNHLNFYLNFGTIVSVFETTIRSLGGLLAAFDWSGDQMFLDKAEDLGSRLLHAFNKSQSGLPYSQVYLTDPHYASNHHWLGKNVLLAEVGTLTLEFRYLSKATGKKEYADAVDKVFDILTNMSNTMNVKHGLFPYQIDNSQNPPTFTNDVITFGAMADSFYEYLLKVWLQEKNPHSISLHRDMYERAMDGVHKLLIQKSSPSGLTYLADYKLGTLDHKMDHLACFMAGTLALGAYTNRRGLKSRQAQRDLKTGKALAYTCYQMYVRMKTGISPEAVRFNVNGKDISPLPNAPHYILRPEAVESFFILNQLTGDPIYREWGWEIFLNIEKFCRTDSAYASIQNVNKHPISGDRMESFFLGETLKYLYLLQDPDTEIDILNKHVFNTEAHPLRMFNL